MIRKSMSSIAILGLLASTACMQTLPITGGTGTGSTGNVVGTGGITINTTSVNASLDKVIQDTQLISASLQSLQIILVAENLSTADVTLLQAKVTEVQTLATTVKAAVNVDVTKPLIATIADDINSILLIATKYSVNPKVVATLQAIQVLIPVVQIAVGLLPAPTPAAPNLDAHHPMTPDEARLVLATNS